MRDLHAREDFYIEPGDGGTLPSLPEVERLEKKIAAAIENCRLTGEDAVFAVVAIDHMDVINMALGFETGDTVLAEAATELRDVVRGSDHLSRISGSKFGILLGKCSYEEALVACKRFRDRLRHHVFRTSAGPVSLTVSISAVIMPRHAATPREAIGHAMAALADARRDRLRSIAFYRQDWQRDRRRQEDARLAQNVFSAIAEDRMCLAFQPVVDARTGQIAFHEALIRIRAHDGTLADAASFIAAAERLGIIRMVDLKALNLALAELRRSPEAMLSVNVSYDAVHDPAWLRELMAGVEREPDLAARLIVEITESQATLDVENTRALIESVRGLGCRVAIDDFGAGYTSFRNLKQLPFDLIKIDGEFAQDLDDQPRNQTFIRALVDIAHAFDARIVVEWVTGEETARLLRSWGVDYLQGFGIGEPLADRPWEK